MTASWSPLTRRLVALGLLILALLGVLNLIIMPVATMLTDSLDALHDNRFRLARLDAIDARPPLPPAPVLAPGLTVTGIDQGAAAAALIGNIGAAAARAQLALEPPTLLPSATGDAKRLALRVAATGPEPMMLQFVNELERGAPLIRFRSWRLSVVEGSPRQLRFEAIAVAAWAGPQ
jgi:Type II secretion system (T2SS), protein M subtype b